MKRTKYDKLMAFHERFFSLVEEIPDEEVQRFCRHWYDSAAKIHDWLADPSTGVKKSAVAEGLEQGLRELPEWFHNISPEWRTQARQAMEEALTKEFPDFFSRDRKHLAKVIARGEIRNEAEYYMIRHEIGILEGNAARVDELNVLRNLLAGFEYGC